MSPLTLFLYFFSYLLSIFNLQLCNYPNIDNLPILQKYRLVGTNISILSSKLSIRVDRYVVLLSDAIQIMGVKSICVGVCTEQAMSKSYNGVI